MNETRFKFPKIMIILFYRHRRKRTNLDSAEPKVLVYLKDGVLVNDYMRDN